MKSILDALIDDIHEKLNEMKKEDENEALGIEEEKGERWLK